MLTLLTWITTLPVADKVVLGYVPNWFDKATNTVTIDFSKLSYTAIAFENPKDSSGTMSYQAEDEIIATKAHAAGSKVLLSIGGGSLSENPKGRALYFQLLAPGRRDAFVATLTKYVLEHHFDGLDVDLEGPAINKDYPAFIDALRRSFMAKNLTLTAALSMSYGGSSVPSKTLQCFDYVNVMAYDATGPWDPTHSGQHSSEEFARASIDYFVGRGAEPRHLLLGIPFYGHGFGKEFTKDEPAFADILNRFPDAYDKDEEGETIYYNGSPLVKAKCKIINDQRLAGAMIWSVDLDATGRNSLLSLIHDQLSKS